MCCCCCCWTRVCWLNRIRTDTNNPSLRLPLFLASLTARKTLELLHYSLFQKHCTKSMRRRFLFPSSGTLIILDVVVVRGSRQKRRAARRASSSSLVLSLFSLSQATCKSLPSKGFHFTSNLLVK